MRLELRKRKEEIMKRIFVFSSVFVLAFSLTLGAVLFCSSPAEARIPPGCLEPLPCIPDNIYCTSIPCSGHCHKTSGGIFYCAPDWETEYCSTDWWYPVPCSHQI